MSLAQEITPEEQAKRDAFLAECVASAHRARTRKPEPEAPFYTHPLFWVAVMVVIAFLSVLKK